MSTTNRSHWRNPFDYLDWREVGGQLRKWCDGQGFRIVVRR